MVKMDDESICKIEITPLPMIVMAAISPKIPHAVFLEGLVIQFLFLSAKLKIQPRIRISTSEPINIPLQIVESTKKPLP